MQRKRSTILILLPLILAACQPGVATVTPTSAALATPTSAPALTDTPTPASSPAPTVTISLTATANSTDRPQEAIVIQEPGPGSRVTGPIRVVGFADPTFEQTLVVRTITADGTEVNQVTTTIQADVGQRGKFEASLPVTSNTEQNLFIQVYATSPRDGGVTHLASTTVTYSPGGLENIAIQEPGPEKIAIFQPRNGETLRGGMAHVEGFALASFEQTLLVEIIDAGGNVIGSQPVTVQAPDLGQPGPFSADVPYSVAEAGPGRIVVRDPSPAFDGNTHLNSVEVTLEP